MKIIRVRDYEEMSQKASEYVIHKVREKPDLVLGLATGSTPKGLYQKLIDDHKQNGTSYEHVSTINLDEYIGLRAADKNSYHTFMNEFLFRHLNLKQKQTFIPNGEAAAMEEECFQYESLLDKKGIDLQILGIGQNGHIGFNEPGTPFSTKTHVTVLSESTRQANARFFPALDDVPAKAVTMGIASIMKSKSILLLASGEQKAAAIRRLLSGRISESFPASVLTTHADVTLIADDAAFSLVSSLL